MHLGKSDVTFATSSLADRVGKVFFHGGRVFRAVYGDAASASCLRILQAGWIEEAFAAGLVKTWVAHDVSLEGASLVLEHERISFAVTPPEFTARMHWAAAKTLVQLGAVLARRGVYLKDAHPWNVMFHRGVPQFVDFGSLQFAEGRASWLEEYRRYFAVPIWLAARGMDRLAREYRRQHATGFGLRLFDHPMLRWPLRLSLAGPRSDATAADRLFEKLGSWLEAHEPKTDRERWASYRQSGTGASAGPLTTGSEKQRFVSDAIASLKPATVLDCAANKGLYSDMAARLGAAVVAFDYEEFCVDECLTLARRTNLDITPAVMDFRLPTPPSGWALAIPSAFDRFRSECLLALGLCHHLCIAQGLPVETFCEICLAYSTRGVVLEYVDPADVHVAGWKLPTPADYSIEGFTRHLARKYPRREVMPLTSEEGVKRAMLLFHG
jgi:hypothetical protein